MLQLIQVCTRHYYTYLCPAHQILINPSLGSNLVLTQQNRILCLQLLSLHSCPPLVHLIVFTRTMTSCKRCALFSMPSLTSTLRDVPCHRDSFHGDALNWLLFLSISSHPLREPCSQQDQEVPPNQPWTSTPQSATLATSDFNPMRTPAHPGPQFTCLTRPR